MHNYEGTGETCGHCGCGKHHAVHFPTEADYRCLASLTADLAAAKTEVERLKEATVVALEHVVELRDAWMRGAIRDCDGHGGLRSNRNVDVEHVLRNAIEGKPRPLINVIYSPAWLFGEEVPDAQR